MRFQSVVFAAVLAGVSSVAQAQEAVKSPRDVASGLLSLVVRASNSHETVLGDIIVSSYTLEPSSASNQCSATAKQRPQGWKMTLPAGAASQDFSFGTSTSVMNKNCQEFEAVVLRLEKDGVPCLARIRAQYDAATKRVLARLGDLAVYFDATGRPISTKCTGV
jgi:hypothetical protein